MQANRFSLLRQSLPYAIFIVILVFSASCGPKFEEMTAQQIHEYGEGEFGDENYQNALDAYNALIDLYPFSIHVTEAELRSADCHYMRRHWTEAEAAYQAFFKRHPNHPRIDHVIFRIGMCNYKQKLAVDRDLDFTHRAEAAFSSVTSQHPESEHYQEAQERLAEVRHDLAKRERYVARHYWREKEYFASFKRWERIIRLYSDTEYFGEALYYGALCLLELDEQVDARRYLRLLLKKFPEGKYAEKAKELLSQLE